MFAVRAGLLVALVLGGEALAQPQVPACEPPKVLIWGECVYDYGTPDKAPPPPELTAPERGCRENLGTLPVDIRFAYGAYEARYANAIWVFGPERRLLTVEKARDEIVKALKNDPDILLVEIQGHTSSLSRPAQTKLALAKERAEGVKKLLTEKTKLAPARFVVTWYGDGCEGDARDEVRLVILERRAMKDRDGDQVADKHDKCPDKPEDRDDFEDNDGCPELDNDRDGVPDTRDQCPFVSEDRDGKYDEDGCPETDDDRDGDGILDAADKCPAAGEDKDGYQDEDGCPEDDNDGDGIIDALDDCPGEPEDVDGCRDEDGCPDVGACREPVKTPETPGAPWVRGFFPASAQVADGGVNYVSGALAVPMWRYPIKGKLGFGLGGGFELGLELRPTFTGNNEVELSLEYALADGENWALSLAIGAGGGAGLDGAWSVLADATLQVSYYLEAWALSFHVMPQVHSEDADVLPPDVTVSDSGVRFFMGVTVEYTLAPDLVLLLAAELDVAPSHRLVHELDYLDDPDFKFYPSVGLSHTF